MRCTQKLLATSKKLSARWQGCGGERFEQATETGGAANYPGEGGRLGVFEKNIVEQMQMWLCGSTQIWN